MDFKNLVSNLFSGFPNSQKFQSPLSDPFYYDEFGTVKSYENLVKMAQEQLEIAQKGANLLRTKYLEEYDKPEIQKRLNHLELRNAELECQIIQNEIHHINQHIQVAKTIVALSKILRPMISALPITEKTKAIAELIEKRLPWLIDLDKKLEKLTDKRREDAKNRK